MNVFLAWLYTAERYCIECIEWSLNWGPLLQVKLGVLENKRVDCRSREREMALIACLCLTRNTTNTETVSALHLEVGFQATCFSLTPQPTN